MPDEKKRTNRIEYLDFIKAVSILLVVFCHSVTMNDATVLGNILMAAAWAACPLFFMAAGAVQLLSAHWKWKKYFLRLLNTYAVLVVWKALYLGIYAGLNTLYFSKAGLVQYLFFFGSLDGVTTGHLWFMYAYLMQLLLLPALWHLYHAGPGGKKALLFLTLAAYAGSSFVRSADLLLGIISQAAQINRLSLSGLGLVMPFGTYAHMTVYFVLGAFLHADQARIAELPAEKLHRHIPIPLLSALAAGLGLLGLLCIKFYQTGSFRWENTYLTDGYYWFSTLLMSVGLYTAIQHAYSGKSAFARGFSRVLGTRTQAIYYLHMPVLSLLERYLYPCLTEYYSFALNIGKTLAVVLICLMVTALLERIPLVRRLI
ncbi:MAG: acyltransferase family protein [Hominenteromicrobium sp.]